MIHSGFSDEDVITAPGLFACDLSTSERRVRSRRRLGDVGAEKILGQGPQGPRRLQGTARTGVFGDISLRETNHSMGCL